MTHVRAGADPLEPWRAALRTQMGAASRRAGAAARARRLRAPVGCEVAATPIAYAASLGPWLLVPSRGGLGVGLGFELAPGLSPHRIVVDPDATSLEVDDDPARRLERGHAAYLALVSEVVTAYAPDVRMGSRQRWGVVDDMWAHGGAAGARRGRRERRAGADAGVVLLHLRAARDARVRRVPPRRSVTRGTRVTAMLQHLPGSDLLVVHEEVHEALEAGVGVVALESTILAHGLPHPDNIEIGAQIEDAVRAGGSVPATIAVLDGVVHIGLGAAEVERVCTDPDIAKLSVRDVGVAAALGLSGATTVASTSALAHLAGIRVFATGGLGGVHRGASETFDVSADLGVIASTPVLVVCAGVKSILDVAGTLETLETLSVPVVGYRTDAFPGFYLSDSGHPVPWRVESAAEAARVVVMRDRLGDRCGRASSSPTRCPPTGRSTASCTTGWWRRGSPCSSARACTART